MIARLPGLLFSGIACPFNKSIVNIASCLVALITFSSS
jgi:hypothetical protein